MPDGDTNTPGQEPNSSTTSTTASEPAGSSSRSIDGFPAEAQDYIRRLREENAKHRNELKSTRDSLQKFEDQNKTEQQRALERAEAAERTAAESATKLLRYEVAAAKGLPLKYAGRLQGSTKEELEADADNLMKDFGLTGDGEPGNTGGSGFDGGVRRPAGTKPKSMNGFIRQASGR